MADAKPTHWQFRYVFADGQRSDWSGPLAQPRRMKNASRMLPGDDHTFEVRDLFPGPVGGGIGGVPAPETNEAEKP